MTEKIAARLHVAQDLPAQAIELSAAPAHYLRHVLRLERGAAVALFNGRDGEWEARIDGFGRGSCTLSTLRRLRAMQAEPDLWLVFAPIKRARLEFLVEKTTELGVAVLKPVITRHTIVDRVNVERLRATAIEAAEQCERLTVPRLLEAEPLAKLASAWPAGRRLLVCDETGRSPPIADALRAAGTDGPWAILTGPEGGFAEDELDGLRKLPFVTPVGLGPRVLRADTAAIVAVAVFQALASDRLGARAPRRQPDS